MYSEKNLPDGRALIVTDRDPKWGKILLKMNDNKWLPQLGYFRNYILSTLDHYPIVSLQFKFYYYEDQKDEAVEFFEKHRLWEYDSAYSNDCSCLKEGLTIKNACSPRLYSKNNLGCLGWKLLWQRNQKNLNSSTF